MSSTLSSWSIVTIDEIKSDTTSAISIGPFGSRMKAELYVPESQSSVPVIRGTNISGSRSFEGEFVYVSKETADGLRTANVFPSDLVFPHRGAIGQVGIVPDGPIGRYMLSTSLMKLTCNTRLCDPLYLFYFFRSSQGRHELLKNASQVGTPGIATPLQSLRSITVPLPPLSAQRAIAHALGTLDDKIKLNRQMNQTLDEIARTLFGSWFVDFDPVHAKMEGLQPYGMDAETAALFPDSLVESELGPIPEGWDVVSVYDLANVIYGAPFASSRFSTERVGVPLLRIRDLATHDPGVSTDEVHPRGTLVRPGDLVVGMDGEFRAHLWTGPDSFLNQRLCKLDAIGCASRAFIRYVIEEPLRFYERSKTGTTVIHLGKSDIDRFRLLRPSQRVLNAFSHQVEPLLNRLVANALENRTLAELRDMLLPQLLSGRLQLPVAGQGTETRDKMVTPY